MYVQTTSSKTYLMYRFQFIIFLYIQHLPPKGFWSSLIHSWRRKGLGFLTLPLSDQNLNLDSSITLPLWFNPLNMFLAHELASYKLRLRLSMLNAETTTWRLFRSHPCSLTIWSEMWPHLYTGNENQCPTPEASSRLLVL